MFNLLYLVFYSVVYSCRFFTFQIEWCFLCNDYDYFCRNCLGQCYCCQLQQSSPISHHLQEKRPQMTIMILNQIHKPGRCTIRSRFSLEVSRFLDYSSCLMDKGTYSYRRVHKFHVKFRCLSFGFSFHCLVYAMIMIAAKGISGLANFLAE